MERFRSSEPSTRRRWSPWPTIQTGSISSREPHASMAGRQKPIAQRSPSSRPGTWTSHCCRRPSCLTCRSRTTRVLARWPSWRVDADSARSLGLQISISLAGASSDWLAVDAIATDIAASGLTDPVSLGPIAFWLAVQERYAEAAAVYARIGPLPEDACCGWGVALLGGNQGLPALLRTYRATGRADEAQKLASPVSRLTTRSCARRRG